MYLFRNPDFWQRPLLRLMKAHDRGSVSDHGVADQLAEVNYRTYEAVRDGTVGPRCIVIWRRRRDPRHPGPGGGLQFYTGIDRDERSAAIPGIVNGLDTRALAGLMMEQFQNRFLDQVSGINAALEVDLDELNQRLDELLPGPDERLR